jgi:hypothetical protein
VSTSMTRAKSRFSRSSITRALALVFVMTLTGIAVAACGGSPSASVANLGSSSTTSTTPRSAAGSSGALSLNSGGGSPQGGGQATQIGMGGVSVKYSQCMQTHGVPSFPDPNGQGLETLSGVNPNSASFEAAQKACAKYAPNGGKAPSAAQQQQAINQALNFSKCMRSHGVSDFPDPQVNTSGGHTSIGIRINGSSTSDLSPNNPQFQAAQKACQSLMPGPLGATKTATAG